MIDQQAIRESIPEECELTLAHAAIHLETAICAQGHEDWEQVAHDASLAARILLCVTWNTDEMLNRETSSGM